MKASRAATRNGAGHTGWGVEMCNFNTSTAGVMIALALTCNCHRHVNTSASSSFRILLPPTPSNNGLRLECEITPRTQDDFAIDMLLINDGGDTVQVMLQKSPPLVGTIESLGPDCLYLYHGLSGTPTRLEYQFIRLEQAELVAVNPGETFRATGGILLSDDGSHLSFTFGPRIEEFAQFGCAISVWPIGFERIQYYEEAAAKQQIVSTDTVMLGARTVSSQH